MKILWIAPIPLINNSDAHPAPWVMTLAKAIMSRGNSLTIVNYNSQIKKDIIKVEHLGIKIIYIKTPTLKIDLLTFYTLRINIVKKYLRRIIKDFDILHIHGTEHQYEAMSNNLKIPKVISIQGIMSEYIKYISINNYKQYIPWKLSAIFELKFISKNNNYSCRTHWDSNFIKKNNPNANIFMIWEMIRKEFFNDNFSTKKKYLLFVGGKNNIKGLKELLFAYNNSIQELGFNLIILGYCKIEDIQLIIETNKLNKISIDNIDCRGMQNSKGMIQAYNDSYCLVHPTYIDNSPNSVCEAQLSGLPVIATNVGGVSSLIDNNRTGILIGRDVKEIENAIEKLYNDDELWKNISINSRIVSRKRHNPDSILDKTLLMYKNIINDEVS